MSKALRILITGAARGMGMAAAQVLANRGHSVVATDVAAVSELEGIQAHVLDVTSDDSVARCLEEVGPLDAVVNNAGMFAVGPVEDYPLDRFRQMFETNTLGPLRVIQAVLPACTTAFRLPLRRRTITGGLVASRSHTSCGTCW